MYMLDHLLWRIESKNRKKSFPRYARSAGMRPLREPAQNQPQTSRLRLGNWALMRIRPFARTQRKTHKELLRTFYKSEHLEFEEISPKCTQIFKCPVLIISFNTVL